MAAEREQVPDTCDAVSCYTEEIRVRGDILTRLMGLERCILPELRALWALGIRTVCSCCGHGDDARAYIRVIGEDADKMLAMGYEPYEPHACLVHEGTASFRAQGTATERAKPAPEGDPEKVREMWRDICAIQKGATEYV